MKVGVLWTNLSQRSIADELRQRGFRVSVTVVKQLLKLHRMGQRKIQKKKPMGRHAHRNQQFEKITRLRTAYWESDDPILSVDTKKKEFLGDFHRDGAAYSNEPTEAYDHDFPAWAKGVVYPHGLLDIKRNLGHINVGTSHDTSRFACDSIAYWWEHHGRTTYPKAKSILLLCDGGGSNSSRRYVFKNGLEQLADRINIEIRIAHYPPYTSKFNPIEHRFFCHVTEACRGVIFTSVEVAMAHMAKTRTKTGLRTTVNHLSGDYPIGEKAPVGYKENMRIVFDEELPAWNYCAIPSKWGS